MTVHFPVGIHEIGDVAAALKGCDDKCEVACDLAELLTSSGSFFFKSLKVGTSVKNLDDDIG